MSGRLPQTIQPARLAETGAVLRGRMGVTGMARLGGYLHDTEGDVEVGLEFGIDEVGTRYIRGHLQAELHLVCQRCLQAYACPLDVEVSLGLAGSEQATEGLPERFEPLVLDEPSMELARLVEDELILALPIVPTHPIGDCGVDRGLVAVQEEEEEATGGERHPFAGLAELLKGDKG